MNTVSLSTPELENFLAAVTGARIEHFAVNGFTFVAAVGVTAEHGDKFIRVYSTETQHLRDGATVPEVRQSIHSFIATRDFSNRTLGDVKAGDVMKPASWKAPAKHARGNVFDESGIECVNHYGPEYLR